MKTALLLAVIGLSVYGFNDHDAAAKLLDAAYHMAVGLLHG
jgi:hypothetical protein